MGKSNTKILAILFIGVLMGALDISIVGPAIPSIEKTIQIEPRMIGWIFSIYVLFNLVGISLFAKLSDMFGRRIIYVIAVALFGIGSLLVSMSDNFTFLLIGRAVQGFGASGIFPVASATIGDVFPPEKRGSALGMIGAVFGLAFIIGPIIAGILLSYFKWNVLFSINIPIAIILIILSLKILPSEPVESKSRIDWVGILTLALMLSSFTLGINLINPKNFLSSLKIDFPFFVVAFVLLIFFVWYEYKSEHHIIKISMFFSNQIRLVGLIAIVTGIFQATFVYLPDLAVNTFKVTSSAGSFMLLPTVIATAIGSPLSGKMLDKYGSRLVVLSGLFFALVGFILMSLHQSSPMQFYISSAIFGFGFSFLVGSSLRYIMLNEVEKEDRALTQGMLTIFTSIGQMSGAALIGAILASTPDILKGYSNVFQYISILILFMLISAFWLRSRKTELALIKD
jgi:EmrB/QacA subfamily drug resistance transporter